MRVGVVGASGYTGIELVRILGRDPAFELATVCGDRAAGTAWSDVDRAHSDAFDGDLAPYVPDELAGLDAVFLALPSGVAASAAADLHGRVGTVVDLSGDLRLATPEAYREHYGREHPAPHLLGRAVYGLPELFGAELAGADLVACAGCYATAIQLAAAPALAEDGVATAFVATAASGTSGAGRRAEASYAFTELYGDYRPYRVGCHQHVPEIRMGLERKTGRAVELTFVPHLAPFDRGILATVVFRVDSGGPSEADWVEHYRAFYADARDVAVRAVDDRLPGVADVVGTDRCDLAPRVDRATGDLVVVSAIDNLRKGASSQAVAVLRHVAGLEPAEVPSCLTPS